METPQEIPAEPTEKQWRKRLAESLSEWEGMDGRTDRQRRRTREQRQQGQWAARCLCSQMRKALKHGGEIPKTRAVLGYSIADLRAHLESLFQPGMSWDNRHLWHIDHIKPMTSFNFDSIHDPEFRECFALSNLQPLWAEDNLKKGDAWDLEQFERRRLKLVQAQAERKEREARKRAQLAKVVAEQERIELELAEMRCRDREAVELIQRMQALWVRPTDDPPPAQSVAATAKKLDGALTAASGVKRAPIRRMPPRRSPTPPPLRVSVPEAARLIGVSRSQLYLIIKSGAIRTVKQGRTTLFTMKELRAFVGRR